MSLLISSFKQSLKSFPFVCHKTNLYFGFYFVALALMCLLGLHFWLPANQGFSIKSLSYINRALLLLAQAFITFIVPYYTYKHSKSSEIQPFWTFISNTVWPLVLNHIKASLLIFLFFLLLIVPGLYKSVRYKFISQTVFFDELYKKGKISALKGSDQTSRGYFWYIVLMIFLLVIFSLIIGFFIPFLIKRFLPVPLVLLEMGSFILSFYFSCFAHLIYTLFYFEIKKQRGEELSC